MKGMVWFGKKGKFSPRYVGPYKILNQIDKVTYEFELPLEMNIAHLVFHVSMLRMFVSEPNFIVSLEDVSMEENLTYKEVPIEILD